jgi:uncharacterized protein (TIGR02598 family)
MKLPPRFHASRAAFSLAEVTLSVGLLSVCLLTMVGLMPVGLGTMRKAMDQTATSQIVQRLNSEAALTPFSKLDDFVNAGPRYFDQDGQTVPSNSARSRFKVTLKDLGLSAPFPGAAHAANFSKSMRLIQAEITDGRAKSVSGDSVTSVISIANSGG